MADKNWGNCKSCKYFSSQNASPRDTELAKCTQPELQRFELLVAGGTGCNAFEARVAAGSTREAEQPAIH